jgi:glucose/arabinose dehydrogenase
MSRRRLPRGVTAFLLALNILLAPFAYAETSLNEEGPVAADSDEPVDPEFTVTQIAGPFNHPWSIGFLPDGRMLVSERWGELLVVTPGEPGGVAIAGVPTRLVKDHAGLMDVLLDPDFSANHVVYLAYAHGNDAAATVRVLKGRLNLEKLVLEDSRVIFETSPPTPETVEFGGRMVIDRYGFLFLSIGDRFESRRAQDVGEYHGTIIRMHRDGGFPSDNPFFDTPGARPGIWTYGHRNPQGLAIDPATGTLWAHEHGPMGGDELNRIERGRNYGWPVITYGKEYDGSSVGEGRAAREGMEQPVRYWVPSIAPSGLTFYEGPVDEWRGMAWMGALAGQMLVRLKIEDGRVVAEEQFLKGRFGRIRDVRTGPDGFIYFSTDAEEGNIYRVEPFAETASRALPVPRELR